MEFSSIADLASPPPKLRKVDEYVGSAYGVQDLHARDTSPINLGKGGSACSDGSTYRVRSLNDDDDPGVLNLSADTSA